MPRATAATPVVARHKPLRSSVGSIAGAKVERRDDGLVVRFDEPLFRCGDASLSSASRDRVGAVLTAADGSEELEIVVVGLTSDSPVSPGARWQDNWELGITRAMTVAEVLRRQDPGRRHRILITSSPGDADGEYLDHAGDGDCTALLRIRATDATSAVLSDP